VCHIASVMPLTLAQAQANLTQAQTDLQAAQGAQSHALSSATGGRSLTRGQVGELLNVVKYWQGEVNRLERNQNTGGGIRLTNISPL
jgi:multidrug resistance efflux pump